MTSGARERRYVRGGPVGPNLLSANDTLIPSHSSEWLNDGA